MKHDPIRRRTSHLLAGLSALSLMGAALPSHASDVYPAHPITMIVGWPVGGPSDNVARLVARYMSDVLGQPVVIENRAGAGSNIGSEIAARAKPDGYTIMFATSGSHGLNSELYAKLSFRPIEDFAPIGLISNSPSTLVVPADSPYRSVKDIIETAKAQPGKLNYGSGGVGSSQHLAGARFKKLAGIDVVHIPYKGTAPALTDLMAGRLDLILTTGAGPFVNSGKLRALAVAAPKRMPALPDVPTFDEVGMKGFYADSWYGLVAPAATPGAALKTLNGALLKALQNVQLRQQLIDQGAIPAPAMTPDEFWGFVKRQMPEAAALAREAGAKFE